MFLVQCAHWDGHYSQLLCCLGLLGVTVVVVLTVHAGGHPGCYCTVLQEKVPITVHVQNRRKNFCYCCVNVIDCNMNSYTVLYHNMYAILIVFNLMGLLKVS